MNNEIIKRLCDVYDSYGSSLFEDAQKFKGLLADILYDFPKERKRLNLLIEENVVKEILKPGIDILRLNFLAQTLNNDIGIDIDMAIKMVFSVAYVVYRKDDYLTYLSTSNVDQEEMNKIVAEIESLIDEDEKKAFSLALEYAEKGYSRCMTILGTMYRDGWGVNVDINKGYDYILRAANQNDANAYFELATFYETGEVVDKDIDKAIEMLKKSADLGLEDAYFRLGAIYENTYKDLESALKYYLMAAEKGICESYSYIADIYINKESLNMDATKANEFYQKSIDAGLFVEHSKYMMTKCRSEILGAKYNVSVLSLLKRGKEALKNSNWNEANRLFDQILNIDSTSCDAYYGKFLADIRCPDEKDMVDYWFKREKYDCSLFEKLKSIAVGTLKSDLDYYEKQLHHRIEQKKLDFLQKYNMLKPARGILCSAMYGIFAVKSDGTVIPIGKWREKPNLDNFENIVSISGGNTHIIGLKADGTVVASSRGYQISNECDVKEWKDIVQIVCAAGQTVGLKKNGTVVVAGESRDGDLNVSTWQNIKHISKDYSCIVGVKYDGTTVHNTKNHLPTMSSVLETHCSDATAYIKSDGSVEISGWFYKTDIEAIKNWKDVVSFKSGQEHVVALTSKGNVLANGNNDHGQCNVSHWKDIIAIECDISHTYGVTSDGRIVTTNPELQLDGIRLFDNIKTLEKERKIKHKEYNEKKRLQEQLQVSHSFEAKGDSISSKIAEIKQLDDKIKIHNEIDEVTRKLLDIQKEQKRLLENAKKMASKRNTGLFRKRKNAKIDEMLSYINECLEVLKKEETPLQAKLNELEAKLK